MAKCLFSGSSGGLPKSLLEQITAGAGDVLAGKVIVGADGEPLTGTIELKNGQTVTPTSNTQTIACKGKYMTGDIVINGANIFKVASGTVNSSGGTSDIQFKNNSTNHTSFSQKFTIHLSGFKAVFAVAWHNLSAGMTGFSTGLGNCYIGDNYASYTVTNNGVFSNSQIVLPAYKTTKTGTNSIQYWVYGY